MPACGAEPTVVRVAGDFVRCVQLCRQRRSIGATMGEFLSHDFCGMHQRGSLHPRRLVLMLPPQAAVKAQRADDLRTRAMDAERARGRLGAREDKDAARLLQHAKRALLEVERQQPTVRDRNRYSASIPHELTVTVLTQMRRLLAENIKRVAVCVSTARVANSRGGRALARPASPPGDSERRARLVGLVEDL
jgi:hypothetical protein